MNEQLVRQKTLQKFDNDASQYEETSDGQFCSRAYPAVIRKICEKHFSSLLDVGCGTGTILSRIPAEAKLYGIDLSAQMIERAKKTLKEKAELTVGDAGSLPWPQAAFDTVSCTFSFHHYPNPEKVLAEINRVLKSGGRLILADPWFHTPLQKLINWVLRYSKDGDFHIYSEREMKRMFVKTGFEMLSFEHPTNDSFLLTASKTANNGGI